jgi:hypothetical protein
MNPWILASGGMWHRYFLGYLITVHPVGHMSCWNTFLNGVRIEGGFSELIIDCMQDAMSYVVLVERQRRKSEVANETLD